MAQSKYRYFYGCIAPELLDRPTYTGEPTTSAQLYELTLAKARKMAPSLILKPIRTEHDNIPCGVITNSWIKQSRPKQWWIQMAIDESKQVGANQIDLITAGQMNALSLTHNRKTFDTIEVSLCSSPARPGAGIVPVEDDEVFQQEPPALPGSNHYADNDNDSKMTDTIGDAAPDVDSNVQCSLRSREPVLVCASKDHLTINYGGLSMRHTADQVKQKSHLPDSLVSEVTLIEMAAQQQQTQQQQQQPAPQTPSTSSKDAPVDQRTQQVPTPGPLVQGSGPGSDSWYGHANRGTQNTPQQIFQFFPQGSTPVTGAQSAQQQQQQNQQAQQQGQSVPAQQQQQQQETQQHQQQQQLPQSQRGVFNYPPTPGEQFSQQFDSQQQQFSHMNRMQEMQMQQRRGAMGMPPQSQLDQFARNAGMIPNQNQGQNMYPGQTVAPWSQNFQNQQFQQQQAQQQQQQRRPPNDMDVDSNGVAGRGQVADPLLQQMIDDVAPPVGGQAGVQTPAPAPGQQQQQQQAPAPAQSTPQSGDPQSNVNTELQQVVQKLVQRNVLTSQDKQALLKGISTVVKDNKQLQDLLKEYKQEKINDREQFRTIVLTWMKAHNGGALTPTREKEVEKAFNDGKFDDMLRVAGKEMLKASQNSLAEHQALLQVRTQYDPGVQAELDNFNALMGAASYNDSGSLSLGGGNAGAPTNQILQGSGNNNNNMMPTTPVIPGQFMYTPPDATGHGGGMTPVPLFGSPGVFTPTGQPLMMPFQPQQQQMQHQQYKPSQPQAGYMVQGSGTNMQYTQQHQLQFNQVPEQQQQQLQPQQQQMTYTQTAKLSVNSSQPDVQNYLVQASARLKGVSLKSSTMSWGTDFDKKNGDPLFGNVSLVSPNVPSGQSVVRTIGRKRTAMGAPEA